MPRGSLVAKLEKKHMSWRLRAHILHKAGHTNKGGHWHKARSHARRGGRRT